MSQFFVLVMSENDFNLSQKKNGAVKVKILHGVN